MLALTLLMTSGTATAQSQKEAPSQPNGQAAEPKVPQTAEDHITLAENYTKKAAGYRQDADEHRRMLKAYKSRIARVPKETLEDPWLKKMRLHCERYINEAESLAREADKFAEYHTLRAAELRGQ